ncbi:MAG: hypothetical protein ACE5D1_07145, partial [Fidelibacterota bacterium]
MRITKKLDKLFSEWKQSKTNYTDNFAEDGIVNETLWQNSDPKTLILLKDTNDYSGDLRQLIDRKPWRELGRWSFAMQHTSSSEI